jgi:choline dehydrogenase
MRRWDGEADYLVLGAGSAGCVLADRLSADGRFEVVLVEAGPADRHPFIHVPAGFLRLIDHPVLSWRYASQPDPRDGRVFAIPQGRMLGGTGSMNGMLYVRSAPHEHARWVELGCAGWSFDEILPFYERIENADGALADRPLPVSRPLESHPLGEAFLRACGEAGLAVRDSLNGGEREGAAPFHQNRLGRFRHGPAQTYLRRARRRRNLTILTGTLARRVLFDGTQAIGAELARGASATCVRARREVILACGTIRSPQLLQLSGIGPPALLQRLRIPLVAPASDVGAHLQDHYAVRVTQRVRDIVTLNERSRGMAVVRELSRYALAGRGLLTLGASTCAAFVRSGATLGPDLQLSFAPGSFEPGTYALERAPGMTISVYPSYPRSRGNVCARSADPQDPPAIMPNYLAAPEDATALVAGLRLARRLFAMPALRRWSVGETLPGAQVETDAQWTTYARTKGVSGYHLVGTCRMGGDAASVVDPTLRVRGVTGLRVVDASILPSCTSGNTNAPTLMVAEKGAAMVLEDAR